jgi:hypothetical protein
MEGIDLSSIMVQETPATSSPAPQVAPSLPEPPKKPPTEPKKETPRTDDPDRSSLLTKLKLLFDVFPEKLKQIRPKNFDKLSDEELQGLKTQIEYICGAKTNVEATAQTVPAILKTIEDLAAQFTPLRIQGTHEVCFRPDVQDMIKYTIIDSGFGINSTPQQKLAFTLIMTAVHRHTVNSSLEAMTPEQRQGLEAVMRRAGEPPVNPAPKKKTPKRPVKTEGTTADPRFDEL